MCGGIVAAARVGRVNEHALEFAGSVASQQNARESQQAHVHNQQN
jgi:hypothetical protein